MSEPTISAEQICSEPDEGAVTIASDPSIFESYNLKDQKRVFGCLKRVKPHPEFKADFEWTISFMKETITAAVEENITNATNAIELGEAATLAADTVAGISDEPGEDSLDDLMAMIETDPDAAPTTITQHVIDEGISVTKEARLTLILKLRAEGLSLKQIGDKVGLSGPRVSGILRSL